MPKKLYTPEQIVNFLRTAEIEIAKGRTVPDVCKDISIVEQTCYRWRKEYGGLKLEQARRFKELEKENARLK